MTRCYRLGGICLLPVPAGPADGRAGIAVSWTTHSLLLLDWDRYGTYTGTQQAMNTALGGVLRAFGYAIAPFGSGGAWLVTGRHGRKRRQDGDRSRARPGHEHRLRPAATAGVDRAIRVSTAIAVLAVAGVAAYVSYWHAYAVVCAHGETGVTARLEPATIDGLVYASSMVNLVRRAAPAPGPRPGPLAARARHRRDAGRQHGPGLVPRTSRRGHRGLASGQPGGQL